jgi:hypothetical protein
MAKSRSIGGIHASLSLRDGGFTRGLKSARAALNKYGAMALKAGAVATGAMAAGLVIGTKRTLAMGAELDHLSTQTGMAASSLMRIGQAYKDNGRDAGAAAKDIGRMQKAIGDAVNNPDAEDPFKQLGLSAAKLVKMSPERQFFAIGEAINSIENPALRAAAAMGIFGKSGAELITVFKGSNLEDVNRALGRMPELMDKFSGAMERADTLMGRLPNKSEQFFVGFTSGVVGQLLPALEMIDDHDFANLGESLGGAIGTALAGLTDGLVWQKFSLQGMKAITELTASGLDNLKAIGVGFGRIFKPDLATSQPWGPRPLQGTLDEMDKAIDTLTKEMERRYKNGQERAAAIGKKEGVATSTPQLPDLPQVIAAMATPAKPAFEVNAYQRRGLSLDGGNAPVADQSKQQLELIGKIKDLLDRIIKTREPLTF